MTTRVAASPVFKRLDDGNLEVTVPITIAEAMRGGDDRGADPGRHARRSGSPPGTKHGAVQRLRGEGPPKPEGKGRGDIRYRLEIEVPDELTEEQREAVEKLAEALNGADPRAELLRKAATRSSDGARRATRGRRSRRSTRSAASS